MLEFNERRDEPGLTQREQQILELVADGLSSKQVAQQIGIAPRTVDRHIENLRHKMGARNKSHLIAKAVAYGTLKCARRAAPSRPALALRTVPRSTPD